MLRAEQREVEVNNEEASVPATGIMEISLNEENQNYVKPSDLLGCEEWIDTICTLFDTDKTISDPVAIISNELKEKADLLVKVLRG